MKINILDEYIFIKFSKLYYYIAILIKKNVLYVSMITINEEYLIKKIKNKWRKLNRSSKTIYSDGFY